MPWKQVWGVGGLLLAGVAVSPGQQSSVSDDAGRVTALELAWNHAIEAKDAAALDLLLGDTLVAIDSDGSIANKSEYLASIKDPNYQPTQAVNEQTNVQVYGGHGRGARGISGEGYRKKESVRTPAAHDRHVGEAERYVEMRVGGSGRDHGKAGDRLSVQGREGSGEFLGTL